MEKIQQTLPSLLQLRILTVLERRSPGSIHSKLCGIGPGTLVGVSPDFQPCSLVPSPKCHSQLVTTPVDSLVKFTCRGASPDLGTAEKFALGGSVDRDVVRFSTVCLCHRLPVTVSVTV